MRINRYLATCGVAARRKCEEIIQAGKVTVNGKVIKDLSTQIAEGDMVVVGGKPVKPAEEFVYIMLNKPVGFLTTASDERGRKTVFNLVKLGKERSTNPGGTPPRIFPVGRLDYETEGLLLLTNDGEFARKLTHPGSGVEKVYIATLDREVDGATIKKLERGVMLEGELTHPARARKIAPNIVEIIITQGRNRQVRKMFATLGFKVTKLKRIRVGDYDLGDLEIGRWKFFHP